MGQNIKQNADGSASMQSDAAPFIDGAKFGAFGEFFNTGAGLPAIAEVVIAATVADAETITLGDEVYEFDTAVSPTITAGRIRVDVSGGAGASAARTALIAAINASSNRYRAYASGGNVVTVATKNPSAYVGAISETMAGGGNVVNGSAFRAGRVPTPARVELITRVPTADEVTNGIINFPLTFVPRFYSLAIVTTSTGARIAWDGALTIDATNNAIKLDNAGTADWATTSTIHLLVGE
jgi:hypothetical protein